MEKNIAILLNLPPSKATSEKIRMALGFTLEDDNKVELIFTADGVNNLLLLEKESDSFGIKRSLLMLNRLMVSFYTDKEIKDLKTDLKISKLDKDQLIENLRTRYEVII